MPTSPNQETLEYAGFWPRLIAYLIDLFIVGFVTLLIRLFALNGLSGVPFMTNGILFDYSIVDIVLYLIKVSYFIICVYCTQTTIGKYAMKLKVVSKDGEKLSLFSIIYRETIGRFLSSLFYIGYLIVIIDREKTALHDIICDSRVIYGCTVKKTVFVRTQPAPPNYQQMRPTGMPPANNMGPMVGRPPIGNMPPMNQPGPTAMGSVGGMSSNGMPLAGNMGPAAMGPASNRPSNQMPSAGNVRSNEAPPISNITTNERGFAGNIEPNKMPQTTLSAQETQTYRNEAKAIEETNEKTTGVE